VLLVDYAEMWAGLARLLIGATISASGHRLRVVLLARSAGEWWHELISGASNQLGDLLAAARPVRLGPVTDESVQRGMFNAAVAEFAARLGVTRPAVELTLADPDAVVLVVHAAALSAVLDHNKSAVGARSRGGTDWLASLLQREIWYCAQTAAARGLDLDPGTQRRAVAAACLIGASSEPAAAALLRHLPDLVESAERRGRVARWLHDLYPGRSSLDRRATEWLGSLCPDRVAEQLIVGELAAQPDLIRNLFTGLEESRARRALTILGHAALDHPHAARLLALALEADFEHLAVPALAVAVEINPMMDRLLAGTVGAQMISAQTLERIVAAIPQRSFALAETAITVLGRLADSCVDGSADRASWLSDLGTRLADLGRHEEAAAAIEEAHTIWRTLAAARRSAYLPSLATSLNNGPVRKPDQA
jgi:hypothetical protein